MLATDLHVDYLFLLITNRIQPSLVDHLPILQILDHPMEYSKIIISKRTQTKSSAARLFASAEAPCYVTLCHFVFGLRIRMKSPPS